MTADHFYALGPSGALRLPNFLLPPLMSNHGNFIVSLGDVCRYLARKAEALGVEIYPGFAAAEVLFENDAVAGIATGDMGIGKDGHHKPGFTRGMELRGKYTLFAEGARGSLTKALIERFGLAQDRAAAEIRHRLEGAVAGRAGKASPRPGAAHASAGRSATAPAAARSSITSTTIWSRSASSFISNYANPYLSPFEEFQRFKTHPLIRDTFAGGKRICYGARAITEGGWQSVPKLSFPGGALIGCAAGFVNVPRIKGSHNAMLSGMLAAEHVAAALAQGRANDELGRLRSGVALVAGRPRSVAGAQRQAAVVEARHLWPASRSAGSTCGPTRSASRCSARSSTAKPISRRSSPRRSAGRIAYQKPDGKLTFDRLSSVYLSNTNHEEDQPVHLSGARLALQKSSEHDVYAGPSARYCPAGVYEWVEEAGRPRFVINAQNCVHCKTCDIKDPNQNINWVPPEGGGGPNYPNM